MHVKPRTPDLRVMDPMTGQYLPPEGADVPDSDYWRRLRDVFGDVVEIEESPAPAPQADEGKPA